MALIMFGAGVIVIAVARRTADGRTGRNQLAGIRTKATLSSDEAWEAAHIAGKRATELGGWGAIASAIASVLATGGLALGGQSPDLATGVGIAIAGGLGTVLSLAGAISGAIAGHRAAVAVRDGE